MVAIVKEKFEAVFKNLFKPLSDLTKYQYNLAGNLTKADHVHNEDHDEEFIYDGAYRLTQYYKDANDEINRVSQDWTVDGVYNWTEFTDYGTTEDRLYDSVNELTAINTNNDADFLYDKNGNLTKWTDDPEEEGEVVKEFYWDGLNRLTKIKVAGNDEAIFIYDTNNQRVRKEYDTDDDGDIDVNDETIEFVWSDGHVVEEYVDGSLDRNYVHGNMYIDELVLFEDSSGDYHYYLQDFRYSVYALVNNQGTNEEEYRFDPYGKRTVVKNDGSIDEHYGFTGRYHDDSDETDLIYFRNRWMSGEMGRFVSRDPLDFNDGMNLYSGWFVVNGLDPLGNEATVHIWKPGPDRFGHAGITVKEGNDEERVSAFPKVEGESIIDRIKLVVPGAKIDKSISHKTLRDDEIQEHDVDYKPAPADIVKKLSPGFSMTAMLDEVKRIKSNETYWNAATKNCADYVVMVLKAGATPNYGLDCSKFCCPQGRKPAKINLFETYGSGIIAPTKGNFSTSQLDNLIDRLNKNNAKMFKCICFGIPAVRWDINQPNPNQYSYMALGRELSVFHQSSTIVDR